MKSRTPATALIAMMMAGALFLMTPAHSAAAFKNVAEGAEAPGFKLKTADGADLSLDDLKKEKAVVLVFFATWSERAMSELADLEKLSKELSPKGLKVVALNVEHEHGSEEDTKRIREKIASLGVTYPVLFDKGLEIYRGYGVVAVPSTAILGEGGIVRSALNGYPSFASGEIRDQVEVMLGLKKAEASATAKVEAGHKPVHAALLNYNLGRRLHASSMDDKAEPKLRAASTADPVWAAPRIMLGEIYLWRAKKDKARLAEAKAEFEAAVAAEPENVVARTGLARVYWKLGSLADSEREVDLAIKKNGSFPPAMLLKAAILGKKGSLPDTEKWVAEALALNPNDPEACALAGVAFEAAGDLKQASAMYRKAWLSSAD
jgi:peroxiredoxin/cytochrome c-type biogenesis protein CcmH/NrfG